ncbi:MAG: 3-methyl-2-oxobutanoate hydroxymethyltransferase [Gammaproteobacteria bacterium]|nr:MAG: 3-methyl-2-oxobutanoate hydroxymethyltransferase [Gammaproteobacteria bacterium]UCH40212.1 MAG: 3-methyl-2-oxobutanoate hydroxymethyltransferase [Gammaproteobacteria bacterium]
MYIPKPLDDKITIPHLRKLKQEGEKFACLTAYDYSFANLVEDCGVEVVLVGDSLGMVIQGHDTTIPVTLDDICYHGKAVAAGLHNAMLMLDMPFGSLNSPQQALDNACELIKQTEAQVVKLEGWKSQLEIVEALAHFGIASCAHLGLQPQMVNKMGGYRVQGKAKSAAEEMLATAKNLEAAGTDLLLLECVPAPLAAEITAELEIPVIGIGAGPDVDGQILVLQDVLNVTPGKKPKFSKNFMQGQSSIQGAISRYVTEVKRGQFPDRSHSFS